MLNPKSPYAAQFREQMVELVRAGRRPGELAQQFGRDAISILNWARHADKASGVAPANPAALSATERQELMSCVVDQRALHQSSSNSLS